MLLALWMLSAQITGKFSAPYFAALEPPERPALLLREPAWWQFWRKPVALRASSVQRIPGTGILASFPSSSQVMLLDENFRKPLWSIGRDRENTFATAESPALFHRQHSAQWIPPDRVLIFDNGLKRSRVVLLRLDFKERKAVMEQEWFAPQPLFSPEGGSATALENGNVLAYFPSSSGRPAYVFEFTPHDPEPVARMRLPGNPAPSVRYSLSP